MVKISDRAIISVNGTAAIITQNDGSPFSLGIELLQSNKSFEEVMQIAIRHLVQATNDTGLREFNKGPEQKTIASLSSAMAMLGPHRRICKIIYAGYSKTYGIDSFFYGIRYHYEIRGKEIYFRILPKWWPATEVPEPKLYHLTENAIRKTRGFFSTHGKEAP